MKSFQDIETLSDKILSKDQGMFFGVDHDDIFFHEYLTHIIVNLSKKYKIHFLLEATNQYVQQTLETLESRIKGTKSKYSNETESSIFNKVINELKDFLIKQNAQLPFLVAAIANHYKIKTKGIDVDEVMNLHDQNHSAEKLSELLAQRTLSHGDGMVNNIQKEIKETIKEEKYIILGGLMHGDIPKKLSIKSINVLDETLLMNKRKEFLFLPKMKALANREIMKPNYVCFYDAKEVKNAKLSDIKVTTNSTSLSDKPWTPAFAYPLIHNSTTLTQNVADSSIKSEKKSSHEFFKPELSLENIKEFTKKGVALYQEKSWVAASEVFQKIYDALEKQYSESSSLEDRKDLRSACFNLGSVKMKLEDMDTAIKYLQRSAEISEQIAKLEGKKAEPQYSKRLNECMAIKNKTQKP